MELTGATCAKSTIYQRWKRFKNRQQEQVFGAMGKDGTDDINDADDDDGGGKAGGDPPIDAAFITPKPTKPTPGGLSNAEVESGLNNCPAWIDPAICEKMLTRGKRKSLTEAHSTRLTGQASTTYRAGRYKNAFKACTSLFTPPPVDVSDERRRRGITSTKGPISVRKAVKRINDDMLASPNDKKLKKTTIQDAINRGSFGKSPLKMGRPRIIPPELTHGLACHAVMMQSSGEGEASAIKMRSVASAMTLGTAYEKIIRIEYLWKRTRMEHPRMIMPAKAINNEDRRVDWLTYKNIKEWNQRAKQYLLGLGMCTPEQGLIRKFSFVCLDYPTTTE